MLGDLSTNEFNEQALLSFFNVPDGFFEKYGLSKDGEIKSQPKINLNTFARAIAKIGYAAAIAHLGGLVFRPLVMPAIILGRYPNVPYFVGTDFSNHIVAPEVAHVRHKIEYGIWEYGRLALIRMTIRLFSDCGTVDGVGMPTYEVLVGALKGAEGREKLVPPRI